MLFDPILCLALLCVVIAFRPTTAQVLANGLQPQHESLQFMMPKAGTVLSIPNTDLFGRTIDRANDLAVVAMPNCQSCTLRRINWATLEKLSRAPAILVFPDAPGPDYPEIHSAKFRVLVEGKQPLLPSKLHDFAPNCIWLDNSGKVIHSVATFALDAPKPRSNR